MQVSADQQFFDLKLFSPVFICGSKLLLFVICVHCDFHRFSRSTSYRLAAAGRRLRLGYTARRSTLAASMNDPAPHDSDPASRRVPVIALTGGIASGKTAVSNAFAARGAPVVDTDVIAREVVAPGSDGLAQVRAEFGDGVITADGALGRAALRRLIFADDGARSRLETILHPLIEGEARARLSRIEAPYAILVVPLLVESGLFGDADRVLVVDVPESVQIERLTARDGVDRTQAESALAAQVSREQRLRHADDVIDNSGSLEALKRRVAELDRDYRQLGDSNDSEPA